MSAIALIGIAALGTAAQPSAPTGLSATATGANQINLNWLASSARRLADYTVWRCKGKSCQNFTQIVSVSSGSTSYQDGALLAGTAYRYRVRAVNTSGSSSSYSNTATATTFTAQVPAAPVITSATSASDIAGTAFSYQITATNSPVSYGATGLPSGLAINPTSGLISGTPAAAGNFNLGLSATNATGTGTAALSLTVSASTTPPQISASPASVSFGTVTDGNTNSQTIRLSNTGGSTLTFSQVALAGSGFGETGLTTSTAIPAGGSLTFNATFDPSSAGAVNGSLTLATNGTPSPLIIALSGAGQAPTVSLAANPASLAFGNVMDDGTTTLTTAVTSSGNSSVTISGVTVTGAGFSASTIPSGTILAPGQSAALAVTFAPTAGGAVSGANVSIASNATNSPMLIALSGTGMHSAALQWTASTTNGVTYNVYRGTSPGGETATPLNPSAISATSYVDTTVAPGQRYYYTMKAVNAAGSSAPSDEASAQIPAP